MTPSLLRARAPGRDRASQEGARSLPGAGSGKAPRGRRMVQPLAAPRHRRGRREARREQKPEFALHDHDPTLGHRSRRRHRTAAPVSRRAPHRNASLARHAGAVHRDDRAESAGRRALGPRSGAGSPGGGRPDLSLALATRFAADAWVAGRATRQQPSGHASARERADTSWFTIEQGGEE